MKDVRYAIQRPYKHRIEIYVVRVVSEGRNKIRNGRVT
jgi:hypothetical protein